MGRIKGMKHKNNVPPEIRFWQEVDKKSNKECWNWLGVKYKKGYGCFDKRTGERRAHRYSWKLHNGEIPDGLFVLHHCDNPSCVNPKHLWLGTAKDNTRDMMRKNRDGVIGEKNGMSKLNENKVKTARKLRKKGYTYQKIADILEVNEGTIYYAIKKETWKHVKEDKVFNAS